jgi:hypothetical protein
MKKLLAIMVLGLLLNGCSDNKNTSITKLIENCADANTLKKFYSSVFSINRSLSENEKRRMWSTEFKKVAINYLKSNLEHKLRNPLDYDTKGSLYDGFVSYEGRFQRCELESKKYPIKFKAKWENYKLDSK